MHLNSTLGNLVMTGLDAKTLPLASEYSEEKHSIAAVQIIQWGFAKDGTEITESSFQMHLAYNDP